MQPGDVMLLHPDTAGPEPPPGGIRIIYEDLDVVAVCKDSGILVHPVRMMTRDTVVNFLRRRAHLAANGEAPSGLISPCHRLDKLTSGIVLFAKHAHAARKMQAAFISGAVRKRYLALVTGRLEADTAICEEPIGPDLKSAVHIRACVRPDGDACVTCVRVLERFPGYTLLDVEPRTGRKHQIRVHLAHLGHPIHGDLLYGPDLEVDYFENRGVNLTRDSHHWLGLHAGSLDVPHPSRPGERLQLQADPPERFTQKLEELRLEATTHPPAAA
jgi:23S rRNA pseudouridine1911/1915/1917 synthase